MRVAMRVLRAGYWDGQYPAVGDLIEVDEEYVATLEQALFAERVLEPEPARRRPVKGEPHGTRAR